MTTTVEAIRTYMAAYSALKSGAPLWVNFLGPDPTQYNIVPLAGDKVIETYLNDNSLRVCPFAFQSMERTADDLERLENLGFYEALSEWFESQTLLGTLPSLASKKTAESIEALNWGYLFEQGQSDSGIYQIQCRLTYAQEQ
jgi:hypothetical protein